MIRSFNVRDIALLHKYRNQTLYFDFTSLLTKGEEWLPARAMLDRLDTSNGDFTLIGSLADNDDQSLIVQLEHTNESTVARLKLVTPQGNLDTTLFPDLIAEALRRLGLRGVHNLIAEVDESSEEFEHLRKTGFHIYVRQRIWKTTQKFDRLEESVWREFADQDEFTVRTLYNALAPGLVRQVEPTFSEKLHGWVIYQKSILMAFMNVTRGNKGIWIQPFIHPQAEGMTSNIGDLLSILQPRKTRPVYICVRSYQAWLEQLLPDLAMEPGPSQVVMVKRLTANIKQVVPSAIPNMNGQAEPTTPFSGYDLESENQMN